MMNIRNQNGVTILSIALSIVVMVILAAASFYFIIPENGILNQTDESRIYMNIAGIQERVTSAFLINNDIDSSIEELINKNYIYKFLNGSNEELYWITREGLANMASGYETDVVNGHVFEKINSGELPEISAGRIRVDSIDKLLNTRIYVIDRNFNVAYIDDKVYGEVEFIKSGTEPEVIWWQAE